MCVRVWGWGAGCVREGSREVGASGVRQGRDAWVGGSPGREPSGGGREAPLPGHLTPGSRVPPGGRRREGCRSGKGGNPDSSKGRGAQSWERLGACKADGSESSDGAGRHKSVAFLPTAPVLTPVLFVSSYLMGVQEARNLRVLFSHSSLSENPEIELLGHRAHGMLCRAHAI